MDFKRVYQYNPFTRNFDSVRKYRNEASSNGGDAPHEFSVTSSLEFSSIAITLVDQNDSSATSVFTFTQSDLLNGNANYTLTTKLGWNTLTQRTPAPLKVGGDDFKFILSYISLGSSIRFKVEEEVSGVLNTRGSVKTYTANFI